MIYDYKCTCGAEFFVVKSILEYSGDRESCPKCESLAVRHYRPAQGFVKKDFEASYYPSIGRVFERKKDLKYHLDKNNLVEVGNDFSSPEMMQNHFDKQREKAREQSWDDLEI